VCPNFFGDITVFLEREDNMTIEAIVVTTILIILTALITYLIATSKAKQSLASEQQALAVASAEIDNLEQQLGELKQQDLDARETIRGLELTDQRQNTELTVLSTRKAELENSLSAITQKADTAINDNHSAEKANESVRSELFQLTKQQQDLQNRHDGLRTQVDQLNIKQNELSKEAKAYEVQSQEAQQQLSEHKIQLDQRDQKFDALQARNESLNREYTELKTGQEEREASHAREVETFEKQKLQLTEQFKVLSTEILAANSKTLQESSKVTLSSVINPFQQSMDSFKKEVQEIHHRDSTQQGELKKELQSLKELNHKLTTEAHELSTALKGQKKLQGNWGELVLENVLDRSGLDLGKDYKREVSFNTEDGRQRPDAIVYLPQGKHLIIDAKVSLNAYTRYINGEGEVERQLALKEHVKAMKDRIKELADRDYYKISELNSPEMVFMFVPIESAFVEAIKFDESLFMYAIENNVLVATPTTLLTSLNIVRQLWRYEDQNKHTAALAQKAELVYKKLTAFLSSFENIKKGLDKANDAYYKAEGQLVSGRGNLVKQANEFKLLAPVIQAELPSYFTDKAELEIEYLAQESGDIELAVQSQ